jgi:hypothetical protein
MSLDKITKLVFDVKCLLASTTGVNVNKAGAVRIVIKDLVPVKDGDFN